MRYNPIMLAALPTLVLATLAYTDQFHYPLSAAEIHQRLLSCGALKTLGIKAPSTASAEISLKQITTTLNALVRQKKLIHQDTWYSLRLADTETQQKFKTRKQRARLHLARKAKFHHLIKILSQVPWVWAIALTGSSAMANAPVSADIDVLIVTAPRRLWLTRAIVLGLSWWYRQRGKTGWCFNLWLEPTQLALAPEKQGVYEAYELWQAWWLFDRASWRRAWLAQNQWFERLLPVAAAEGQARRETLKLNQTNRGLSGILAPLDGMGDWLNQAMYWLETRYRLLRYHEVVPPMHQAFFHTPDVRSRIYVAWQSRLGQLGLLS